MVVFDFYNVLTGKGHHHTVKNGALVYTTDSGRNTLAYPIESGDDHPSRSGNTKATIEFLPLLNSYVNHWLETAPAPGPAATTPAATSQPETVAAVIQEPVPMGGLDDIIDDFEGHGPQWETWLDGDPGTRLTGTSDSSRAHGGQASLKLDYQVVPNGWATYSLIYQSPRSLADKSGLVFFVHAEKQGLPVLVTAYGGNSPDDLHHFDYETSTDSAAVKGWQKIEIPWPQFKQPPLGRRRKNTL